MNDSLSTRRNRRWTLILLTICVGMAIAAGVLGIDDNPPGVLSAYLAAIAFVLAFVHRWRTARQFLFLMLGSALGLVLFIVLNNLSAFIAHDPSTAGTFQILMQSIAVAAFFLGTLIFPAGFIIGVIGSIVMFIRNLRRQA